MEIVTILYLQYLSYTMEIVTMLALAVLAIPYDGDRCDTGSTATYDEDRLADRLFSIRFV